MRKILFCVEISTRNVATTAWRFYYTCSLRWVGKFVLKGFQFFSKMIQNIFILHNMFGLHQLYLYSILFETCIQKSLLEFMELKESMFQYHFDEKNFWIKFKYWRKQYHETWNPAYIDLFSFHYSKDDKRQDFHTHTENSFPPRACYLKIHYVATAIVWTYVYLYPTKPFIKL